MSDPYGQNPYGGQNNPYGQPQQPPQPNPYGSGGGYGPPGGFPGGPSNEQPKNDGVSITALVLSFLCCLAPIGVILGFVGLSRTKGGKRKGRGLAIASIIIGIIVSLGTAAIGVGIFVLADTVVTPDNAKVGQCINVEEEDGSVFLYKKDCSEEHDAEIVAVAEVTDDNLEEIETGMASYCETALAEGDRDAITDYLADLDAVIEDPNDVSVGDTLVCYVEPGEKLSEPIL
ncbi:DUF4190 domain-containing protein [Nocardioides sp. Root190]|uniref:DUF4190 domain-containing protein n=1 Tax=Nocardioides sp. Root190 TaxID=1736488 RepID=UPI000AC7A962|nr:DUF4190 domain-containing protein [Nocardioides sp. Root190]